MRQRITALLLALAVLASVCAVSALAEERPAPADTAQAESPEGEDRPASPETLRRQRRRPHRRQRPGPPPWRGRTWRKM